MFTSLDATIDLIYKLFCITLFIYIFFSGGFGVLSKILTTALKIKISDEKLNHRDKDLFDLQLLRIFHGIHTLNKSDAEIAFKAIDENVIYRNEFKFLTFLPPIGKGKISKLEAGSISAFTLISVIIIFQLGGVIGELKYGYAPFTENNSRVLVSTNKIYNPAEKRYTLKSECKKKPETLQPVIISACNYLTTEDKDLKNELDEAIQTNNNGYITLIVFIAILSFLLFFGASLYFNYRRVNNKFCDYKSKIIQHEETIQPSDLS